MATGHPAEEIMGPTIEASVGMSASRQKNCNSCVQAKRRCDRRTPVCSRCAEKNTACVYSKSKAANRSPKHARQPTPCTEALTLDNLNYSTLDIPNLSFDLNYFENIPASFHPDAATGLTPQSMQDTPSSSDISMDAFMHFAGHNNSSSSDQCLMRTEESHLPERPATPADEEVVRGWEKMASCVSEVREPHPRVPCFTDLNALGSFMRGMPMIPRCLSITF
jgi:hypothetical protein